MSSVTATINVQINAANAAAQLTALQGKVAAMNKGMLAATAGGVMAQEKAIKRMGNVLGSSGMFTTGIRNVHTELGRMHKEFDRGSTTLQHYRQNSKMWGKDHSAINRLAADRVRMLQSQYVALGKEMNGVQKAMQIKPTGMMREFGADAMYATQQQMLFRRNLQMGSTALVNWGKNTQWAGRQMMVGMGIPIALVAAGAIKSFNDIEKSSIAFKRVYGDTTTTVAEKSQMLAKVQQTVGKEMLKYGVSMADTLDMSARAAATGAKGADLIAATRETMRLATLGNMDYNKSLDAVIAMQTAFNIKSSDMAKTTDFLNAVENQTILSMQDMAVAVPRVAPVIKGLGGNVQDLAVMMTALRQGGVSAEQGANALKSGLGSLLNPTSTAIKQFDGLGINLQKIVDTNKGDIIGTLQGLGKALDGLTKYDRQRALEGLFGKYQYSRMGALLKNINSKAAKETMKLAKTNAGELARMSNQELSQISDSPMIKLKAAIEGIKAAAAPLGAVLSDIAAKIVNIATPIVSFFSNNDIAKWALIGTAGIAALAGTFTMVVGVLANFAGSMVKAGMSVKNFFRIITGRGSLAYITSEELEASAAANSLATAAERAGQGLMAESRAAQLLTSQLNALSAAQLKAAGSAGALASAPTALQAASRQAGHASYPITNQKALASLLAADPQRGHIGGTRPLSVDEILALPTPSARNKTAAALVAKAKAEAEAFKADTTGTVPAPTLYGKSNMTLVQSKALNNLTSAGMPARQWASIIGAQPIGATMSNMFETVGLNMGLKTAEERLAFAQSDVGKRLAETVVGSAVTHMNELGDQRVQDIGRSHQKYGAQMSIDSMLPSVIKDAVQRADLPEEVKRAVAKTADVGWVGTDSKTKLSNMGVSASYEALTKRAASEGGKTVSDITRSYAQMLPKAPLDGVPTTITDNVGKPIANILPEGSPQGKRIAATTRQFSYGKGLSYTADQLRKVTPTAPTQPSALQTQRLMERTQRRQLTGNGMMGIGMLASTAMMGMEMAGKEIPNAVNFAVNGLTGIGMASMFFPETMTKVNSGLKAMSSGVTGLVPMLGATGPIGMAVAAVAAVSAGLLLYGKSQVDHLKDQTIKLAKTYSATSEVVEAYADEVGKESRSHREARIAASLATKETISLSESQKAEAKLASESGRVMLQNVKDAFAGGGIQSAITSITGQIGTLMSEGLIGRKGAKNLAVTMGQAIGLNEQQQVQLLGVLDKITGPGIDNPLEVKVKVQKQGFEQSIRDAINGYEQKGWWGKFASSLASTSPTEDAAGAAMAQQGLQTNVSGSGYNQLIAAMRDSGLKTGPAIAAYSREIDKQFKGASMGYNKQDVSSLQSFADGIGVNAPARMGAIRIKAMIAQGDISPEAFDKLFEGTDKDLQRNMLINIGGANTKSEEMISAIMTKGGGEADSLRNWLSTEGVDASKVNAMGNAYEKLGSAASRFNIDFTKTTPKMLESMKPVAKQIENMPISMQKAIQIDPSTINAPKAYAKNLQYVRTAAQVANTSLKGLGLDKKTLNDPKELNKAIKGMKGSKVDLKVRAKLDQKDLKPKGKVDVPTKWKQPDGKIKPPSGKVGVPTKWQQPDGKIKKPDRVVQPVDREIGKENLPKPDPTEQTTNRALGLRPELFTPSPVTQIVNRRVVGESATGGPFTYATGGIHQGDGKVRGPGGPTDDKVNAHLSDGEYVIKASSVEKYGVAFMSAINRGVYKGGFAKGSPGVPIKGSLPPKESDGNSRAAQFGNDYRNVMFEADNIVKEFKFFGNIMKDARKLLGKNFKSMGYEFTKYIVDNFDPKQIQKMFGGKKDVGAKKIRKQYQTEQKYAALDEAASAKWDRRAAVKSGKSLAFGASGAVQSSLSADDMKLSARMPGMWDKILTQRTRAEKANQNAGFNRQISRSDASIFGNQLRGNQSLAQAAEALGVSLEDIANKLANSKDYDKAVANIIKMGNAAKAAKEYMDALAMSDTQRTTQRISNNDQRISNLQALAAAKGRQGVQEKFGKSQSVLEAESAVREAQNAIAQGQIDDINEKYDKQLNILDQIGQHQQAIANLERGRMSVANALSQGDIAAAASAAQQQRNDMAQFARDQMRNQLENQQKAQTMPLQDQINERSRINRDIQNQIALITAQANLEQADAIGNIQAQSDGWMTAAGYVDAMNAELERQNGILALTTAQLQAAVQAQAQLFNVNPPTLPPASGTGKRMSMSVGSGKGGGGKGHKGKGKGKAFGGFIPGVGNSDSVPTMLTPGEFVVRKAAAAKFGPMLKDMNYGSFQTGDAIGGGNVKIDNVVFNINGANLNEREVADIAVRKMHSLNSATIRGGRF